MSVTEDEFCNQSIIVARTMILWMEREGRLLIGFCSFSFGAVPIRTVRLAVRSRLGSRRAVSRSARGVGCPCGGIFTYLLIGGSRQQCPMTVRCSWIGSDLRRPAIRLYRNRDSRASPRPRVPSGRSSARCRVRGVLVSGRVSTPCRRHASRVAVLR